MIPNINKKLEWLEQNSHLLKGINRGIERETLRIQPDAHLAQTPHPKELGSALTHSWITTDFAESLFEFVTPVMQDVDQLLTFLRDVHRYSVHHIGDELLWPLSMPCFIDGDDKIKLAQYGKSNQGKMKTLYREGLKNRYGALMQTISGIHYNFSLPLEFWKEKYQQEPTKEVVSKGYFNIIRNYYRFGWVIPYLFGASPALCSCFLRNKKTSLPFEQLKNGGLYLPYATSLRLSDLGYTNTAQKDLGITFNNLETYVEGLKKATGIKNSKYEAIGVKVDGEYRQLNANVLQIENEFYAPIRPKRVTQQDESPSDALLRGGVEYIEVRSLDINPFTAIGIDSDQVCFLDLFLIWCALADAPEMSALELECVMENWKTVIIAGREPNQKVSLGCHENKELLKEVGKALFIDLARVAQMIDGMDKKEQYLPVCLALAKVFEDPTLTLSAKVLDLMKAQGIGHLGLSLAKEYKAQLLTEPLEIVSEERFIEKAKESWLSQQKIEQSDTLSFDDYLKQHVVP